MKEQNLKAVIKDRYGKIARGEQTSLTEVPIVQTLMGMGMDQGPALALLLAGPALSLPSMIVISRVMGWKKTAVFCTIIVVIATFVGMGFGWLVG
jgi:uncharacterized membrane protein YraQ (UPF0718 family)